MARAAKIIVSDEPEPPELREALRSLSEAPAPELAEMLAAVAADPPRRREPEPDPEPDPVDPNTPQPERTPDRPGPYEDPPPDEEDEPDRPDDSPAAAAIPTPLTGEIQPPADVHYEARIEILDAWQYPGALKTAPAWVDRNWAGWGDYDDLRGIEPGPCLRVPTHTDPSQVTLARIGDYIARQSVAIADGFFDIRVEVWARDNFEKLFFPTHTPRTAAAASTLSPNLPQASLPTPHRSSS